MEANDGQEALDLATQCSDPIQLLITDIVMPRMNGRQLMEQLYPNHPETVVLYMSGYTGDILTH
ncbi:MAG: response regulator, partial [Gemmatimonadota bacterium]|nr:response regulator [Gemmatimonadota bacterium]